MKTTDKKTAKTPTTTPSAADLLPAEYAENSLLNGEHVFRLPISAKNLDIYDNTLSKMLEETERELSLFDYHTLTDAQRQRLLGSGVRRLGFITKTFEIAGENKEFIPPFMDMKKLSDLLWEIIKTRNMVISMEQLVRIYNDILLMAGDDAFRLALMYYSSVRDAARRGVPGAQAIFRRLELFFRRGHQTDSEPTEKETLRDVKALLHGKKDGEVLIKGKAKHTSASEHLVVDDAHKPEKGVFKERKQGTVCSACHTENVEGAKYCVNCGNSL